MYIKGKSQARAWSKTGELEFKIHSVELLSDIREKLTKKVAFEVPLNNIDEKMLERLDGVLSVEKHAHTVPVEFRVVDAMRKLSVKMPSRTHKIDLSNETINDLNKIKGIKYKLIV